MGIKNKIYNTFKKLTTNSNYISQSYDVRHRNYAGEINADTDYESILKHVNTKMISLNWSLLNNIYKDIPLVKRAIQIPIDYATKQKINITTPQLDNEDISLVIYNVYKHNEDTGTSISEEIYKAEELRELFGGCYIILDDGNDPSGPFNIDTGYFRVSARSIWDLSHTKNTKRRDSGYQTEFFNDNNVSYFLYDQEIHPSRILKYKSNYTIDFYTKITRGWGLSIMEHLKTPLLQMLNINRMTTEYIADGKVDMLKLKNYNALLSSQSDSAVASFMERLKLFVSTKNSMSVTAMDSEDDYVQKTLNLTGFDDLLQSAERRFASAVGMSRSLLLGEIQSGIGNDKSGTNNDQMLIERKQNKIMSMYEPIIKLLIKHLFGSELNIDYLDLSFEGVEPLNDLEKSTKNLNNLQQLQMAQSMGILTTEEAREESIKLGLFKSLTE
jgi:hypothetical protein